MSIDVSSESTHDLINKMMSSESFRQAVDLEQKVRKMFPIENILRRQQQFEQMMSKVQSPEYLVATQMDREIRF
ncbi:hypothetical protein [Paenibacillus xylaniclasticus]|uniref:hypothetical protein n=1 Tax=Paenibacillus xylaniclasticus TaxID=588083 RepID=UPI000FDB1F80|nr:MULTISPECIES: hypothetical protein [Paenibacillus]GFN32486.1 hypothetical protein PCURB6_27460 [Paenibacillus curdlanolyticus]